MSGNNRTVNRIQAVWNILGGEEGVDRLIKGETLIVPKKIFGRPSITLTLGNKTTDEYIAAIKEAGMEVDPASMKYLREITCRQEQEKVDIIIISVAELGFPHGINYFEKLTSRAAKFGLKGCPYEVGLALRLESFFWLPGTRLLVTGRGPLKGKNHLLVLESEEIGDDEPLRLSIRTKAVSWPSIADTSDLIGPDEKLVFIRDPDMSNGLLTI